jgi:hypothetical protein
MTAIELVLFIGGAWCVLLGFAVSLFAVASHAEERFNGSAEEGREARRPRFANRRAERTLPGRERPLSRT